MFNCYVIHDYIYSHDDKVYMYSELVKALNNAKPLIDFTFFSTVTFYQNVHSIKRVVSGAGFSFEIDCDDCKKIEEQKLKDLYKKAKQWYEVAKAHEAWDGQLNYLAQSNQLGQEIPVETIAKPRKSWKPVHYLTPHSSSGIKYGRVNHSMGANARYTHRKRLSARELKDYPLTHHSRKDRRHYFRFPLFDDDEYFTAKHSTGWKYSTKCRHQYQIHL